MTFPSTPITVRDSIENLAFLSGAPLGAAAHSSLATAAGDASIVPKCHQVIAVLSPTFGEQGASMRQDARECLAGALKLCISHGWSGPDGAPDYPPLFATVSATLEPDPVPDEDPGPD